MIKRILGRRPVVGTSVATPSGVALRERQSLAEPLEARRLLATYYVDDVASNGNGSSGSPYNTIQAAADRASAGDTVIIRDGTYRETVRPARSGTAASPITFKAAPNATVTINGADRITGWAAQSNNIYSSNMNWSLADGRDQVFVDGQAMLLARWPNSDAATPLNPTWNTLESGSWTNSPTVNGIKKKQYTMQEGSAPFTPAQVNGGRIHVKGGSAWLSETGVVTDASTLSNGRLQFKANLFDLDFSIYGPTAGSEYYLFDREAFLDADGEWFRRTDGTLLLRKPGGGNPNSNTTVEAKRRDNGFDVAGRDHIVIEGVNFFATSVKTDGSTDNLTLRDVDFKYVDHLTRVEGGFDGTQTPWVVANDTGLRLQGNNHKLLDSTIKYSGGNGVKLEGTGHLVRGNQISHVNNVMAGQAAAVFATGSGHLVEYNTLTDSTRNLVALNAKNTKYLHNELARAMLQTTDGGGFYTAKFNGANSDGRSEIAYNYIHDIAANGGRSDKIAAGIYLDNGTRGHDVYRNVVVDVTTPLHQNAATNFTPDARVVNNTFVASGGRSAIVVGVGGGSPNGFDMSNMVIANNIVVRTATTATSSINIASFAKKPQVRDNFDAAAFVGQGPGKVEAVKFVSPGSGDYRLQSSSPAINVGRPFAPYTDGFQGTNPEAGAIEFGDPMIAYGHTAAPPSGGGGNGGGGGGSNQLPFGGTNRSLANGATIEVEDFDTGGQGVAYSDSTAGNSGNSTYRPESSVDVANASNASNGKIVGWTVSNEWLEYTVNATAGTYDLVLTYASQASNPGDVRVKLDGQTLGTFATPTSGGWSTYRTVTLNNVVIPGGSDKVLRLELVGGSINLDKLALTTSAGTNAAIRATSDTVFADGDVIRLQNVAYGTYLDADGASAGWNVDLDGNGTRDDRLWRVKDNGDGVFSFQSVAFAGDDRWLDADPGLNVDLRNGEDNADTEWLVSEVGDGVVQLHNVGESAYLDADTGDRVDLRADGSWIDTRWKVTVVESGDRIDFSTAARTSYDRQDGGNGLATSAEVQDNGETLKLAGNSWKKVDLGPGGYEVTGDTKLSFDFKSNNEGELHGIGLDNNDAFDDAGKRLFQLFGTDNGSTWFEQGPNTYASADGWKRYTINVGQFYTGTMSFLTLVNDDDADASGDSYFRNVRLYNS